MRSSCVQKFAVGANQRFFRGPKLPFKKFIGRFVPAVGVRLGGGCATKESPSLMMLLAALTPPAWLASRPLSHPGLLSPSSTPLTRSLRMVAPLPKDTDEDVSEDDMPNEDAAAAAASADFTVAVAAMAGMAALGVDLMTLNGELGLLGMAVTPRHRCPSPCMPARPPHRPELRT